MGTNRTLVFLDDSPFVVFVYFVVVKRIRVTVRLLSSRPPQGYYLTNKNVTSNTPESADVHAS